MGASRSQERIVLERDAYARPMAMDVVMTPRLHSHLNDQASHNQQGQQQYHDDDDAPPYSNHHGGSRPTTVAVDLDPGAVAFYKENVNRLIQDAYNQGMRDRGNEMAAQIEAELEEQKMSYNEEKLAVQRQMEADLSIRTDELVGHLRRQYTPAAAVQTDCNAQREAVMACYSAHPKDVLQCSDLIGRFVACSREAVRAHGTTAGNGTTAV